MCHIWFYDLQMTGDWGFDSLPERFFFSWESGPWCNFVQRHHLLFICISYSTYFIRSTVYFLIHAHHHVMWFDSFNWFVIPIPFFNFRQLGGGEYFVSVDQVKNSLRTSPSAETFFKVRRCGICPFPARMLLSGNHRGRSFPVGPFRCAFRRRIWWRECSCLLHRGLHTCTTQISPHPSPMCAPSSEFTELVSWGRLSFLSEPLFQFGRIAYM